MYSNFIEYILLICYFIFLHSWLTFSIFIINVLGPEKPSPDLLNCGVCNTAFPLQDITAFIHHKATHCQIMKKPEENNSHKRSLDSQIGPVSVEENKKGKEKLKLNKKKYNISFQTLRFILVLNVMKGFQVQGI